MLSQRNLHDTTRYPTRLRQGSSARAGQYSECPFGLRLAWLLAAILLLPSHWLAAQTLGTASPARSKRFLNGRRTADHGGANALAEARKQHLRLSADSAAATSTAANLVAPWTPVGPNQVDNPIYGGVTGRITALLLDPADATGNTLYAGTTGGGVWKSVNAAGANADVTFTPLTDTLPVFDSTSGEDIIASLSIGSLAAGGGTLLAGTGDPNDSTDSYYGSGILRSTDGGLTWTLARFSYDGVYGLRPLAGLSVAALAFSTADSTLAVAALLQSPESAIVGAETSPNTLPGLYGSTDGGLTWRYASVYDGPQVAGSISTNAVQSPALGLRDTQATSVVWNPLRQTFYAVIRNHGYYQSVDGLTWTRLQHQPGPGLTLAACPTLGNGASTCPAGRGVLAVQPASGDLFALTVDAANSDQGLYQDLCSLTSGACSNASVTFGSKIDTSPLDAGSGSTTIPQADYDLALAATASGSDTILYAGTIDLFRCSLAAGCVFRDTTNAQNGCASPAGVAGAQHAITASGTLVFTGNDGGLWRSTDGAAETGSVCSASDASHFDNLNHSLGSLAEVVSFAQDPFLPNTLLAGLGALGTAGTGSAFDANGAPAGPWTQLSTGEGGSVAIDSQTPANWYLSAGPEVDIARCGKGSACTLSDFASPVLTSTQLGGEQAIVHASWLLDPQDTSQLLLGTCRTWRGPADGGWTNSDALGAPFSAPKASSCSSGFARIQSLAAGGSTAIGSSPNAGSETLYAGMEGTDGSASGAFGHLFATTSANTASGTTAWQDLALSPVTNQPASNFVFNPLSFSVSSVTVDPHDTTGKTVYATLLGFPSSTASLSNVLRSTDGGLHWIGLNANLPSAPASSLAIDPNDANTIYVALDTGVYVTTAVTTCPTENCWSVFGTGLPNSPVTQLVAAAQMPTGDGRKGELRASTYGRGIWQIPLVTAVSPAVAAIGLSPASVAFPAQQVGTQSVPVTITLTNTGNAVENVTSIVTTSGFVEQDSCSGKSTSPSATCTIAVSFAPLQTGPLTGLLTVYANIVGGQATATLSGTGTAPPDVVLTPASLTFPATTVGSTSPPQSITVANTGGNAASLQNISLSGDFKQTANTCASSLPPQTSCTVSIAFTPTVAGNRSGALTVTGGFGSQVAQLSGLANSPPTDTLAPVSLSFGPQQTGTSSSAQQVVLTNSGDNALSLSPSQIAGDFTATSTCGASLAGHSNCAFSVVFVPRQVGLETGTLTVIDGLQSQVVALGGTGLAPAGVALTPANGLYFAASAVGQQSPAQAVVLTNNGGVSLGIGSVTITGDFALGTDTCASTLSAGSACTLEVLFTATQGGTRNGTLMLTDSAANSPQSVSLTGVGVDFSLASTGPSTASISSGATATYLLLLQAAAGVPGNATSTCTGMPANAFCTVSPTSPPLSTPNGTVVTVTIATGQAHASLEMPWLQISVWLALLMPACLIRKRQPHRRLSILPLLALAVLLAGAGCGAGRFIPESSGGSSGGSSPPATIVTPSGTYPILVTASSAGLTRSVNLTLTVQ